jgi:hypothetical protein
MKSKLLLLLPALLCGALAGCTQRPDKNIDALQKQIDIIQDMVQQNHIIATNAMALAISTSKLAGNNTADETEIITKLENYYRATTNIESRLQRLELLQRIRDNTK